MIHILESVLHFTRLPKTSPRKTVESSSASCVFLFYRFFDVIVLNDISAAAFQEIAKFVEVRYFFSV
jgi:hypothetical protein